MGSYVGTIQFRNVQEAQGAHVAAQFNNMHAAILATGMTQVSSADFAGQAGTFVSGSAGPGETLVGELNGGGWQYEVNGYKLYKHPSLNMYVYVEYGACRYGWPSRFCRYGFKFSLELAGGSLTPSKTSPTVYPLQNPYGGEVNNLSVTTATIPLYMNCGADNFWIHAPGAMGLAQVSSNYTPVGVGSMLSVGIFESGGSYGVISTCEMVQQQSTFWGPSLTTTMGPQGSRYWQSDGSSWSAAAQCSFGQMLDPATPTVGGATRVGRAAKVIGGSRKFFRFGFVPGNLAGEGDILSLDLDGAGAKNYFCCYAMGPSSAMSYNYSSSQFSVPVLPWGH